MTSPMDGSEVWIQIARVTQRAGYLTGKNLSLYQETALTAVMRWETEVEQERLGGILEFLDDRLFLYLHPEEHQKNAKNKKMLKNEEGNVDEVVYQGESDRDKLRDLWGIDLDQYDNILGE